MERIEWSDGREGRRGAPCASGLVHGHDLIRNEGEITRVEHSCGVILHEFFRLDMKITEHFVGSPAPNETDDASVNVGG